MNPAQVLLVGPLPPPVYGAALVTGWMRSSLEEAGARVVAVDTGSDRAGVGYHWERATRHLAISVRVLRSRRRLASVYLTGAGGLGLIYQALVALAARLAGVRTVFHHHSFLPLYERRWTMRLVVAAGGEQLEHVVLCERMGDLLVQRYPKARQVLVCSNAALMPDEAPEVDGAARPRMVLGHLSNLSVEKGLPVALEATRAAVAAGHDVELLLGGPVADDDAQRMIDQATRDLPGVIDHIGEVAREDIDDYYARVDLFLVSSPNEAEPLIVLESTRSGVPTVAYSIGCLSAMLPDDTWLVDAGDDYPARVAEIVATLGDADARATARRRTETHYRTRRQAASQAHAQLVERLMGRPA